MHAEELAKHLNQYLNREIGRLEHLHGDITVMEMNEIQYAVLCEKNGLQKVQALLWGLTSDTSGGDNGHS